MRFAPHRSFNVAQGIGGSLLEARIPLSGYSVLLKWESAFEEIGRELRALDPASVVFYASGRASLEAS